MARTAVGFVLAVGSICGDRFHSAHLGVPESAGFLLLTLLASVAIGLITGTFVKRQLHQVCRLRQRALATAIPPSGSGALNLASILGCPRLQYVICTNTE